MAPFATPSTVTLDITEPSFAINERVMDSPFRPVIGPDIYPPPSAWADMEYVSDTPPDSGLSPVFWEDSGVVCVGQVISLKRSGSDISISSVIMILPFSSIE